MGGRTTHVDTGLLEGVVALKELLSNDEKYGARLAEMQAVLDETTAIVELVGPAKEIASLRQEARKDRAAAANIRTKAEADAIATIDEAQSKAAAIRDEAAADIKATRDTQNQREKDQSAEAGRLQVLKDELTAKAAATAKQEAAAKALHEDAQAVKAKYEAALAEIDAFRARVA